MDFDQMLEAWRVQNTAPPYDVDRDALRQALQAEEERIRRELRDRRRSRWALWIVGTGMAVWAGFWIAITIANRWPVIYAFTAAASLALFAIGVVAVWLSRGPRDRPRPDLGHTLQEEVTRSLALVERQLAFTRRWMTFMLGAAAIVVGTGLFSWTVNRSQDIDELSSTRGWLVYTILVVALLAWGSKRAREEMRRAAPKLELRRQRLRELLEALGTAP